MENVVTPAHTVDNWQLTIWGCFTKVKGHKQSWYVLTQEPSMGPRCHAHSFLTHASSLQHALLSNAARNEIINQFNLKGTEHESDTPLPMCREN